MNVYPLQINCLAINIRKTNESVVARNLFTCQLDSNRMVVEIDTKFVWTLYADLYKFEISVVGLVQFGQKKSKKKEQSGSSWHQLIRENVEFWPIACVCV